MPSKFLCLVSIPPNTQEQIAEVLPNFAPLQGFARGISPGQKWWLTLFGKRNFMLPMGRPKHALKVPCFFSI